MQNGVYLKEEVGKTDWAKVEGKKIAGDRGNEHPLNKRPENPEKKGWTALRLRLVYPGGREMRRLC